MRAEQVELEGAEIEKDSVDNDILEIDADIENNLDSVYIARDGVSLGIPIYTPEIIELKIELSQQENHVENALNPVQQQRFNVKFDGLRAKLNEVYIKQSNQFNLTIIFKNLSS